MFIKIVRKPTNNFVVENGKIYQEEFAEGLIIRDETIINTENISNGIVQIKLECEKVAKGENVFRYVSNDEDEINNKINELDVKIQENLESDESMYSPDIKYINNQIDDVWNSIYESNDLNSITQEKNSINSLLTKKMKVKAESSSNATLKELVNERNKLENKLLGESDYIKAEKSGIVSYKIDGLENVLKTGDFSYLSEEYIKNLNIEANQLIANVQDKGKIIDNFQAYIACVLESDEAKASEEGKSVKLRLQNSEEISAKIVYKKEQDSDKVLLVFEVDKEVDTLTQYRMTSFEVIWWSDSGLKMPNSAIQTEGDLNFVIRNRGGLKEKIYIKVLRKNEKYSIVENMSYAELKEAGCDISQLGNKKSISVYDQIEN